MKKNLVKLLFSGIILMGVSNAASAQIYVNVRPVVPVVVRTNQPSPAHVWIGEEWEPNGGAYRYNGGRWETAPHEGYRYNQGHWRRHGHDGEEWVHGEWRK